MAAELVVTPGGYRPSDMVHKIGADLGSAHILTGRLQGVDASDEPVADYRFGAPGWGEPGNDTGIRSAPRR